MNTQQYIQNAIIDKAKEKLSTTQLSVSEIAYEHLYKAKTNQSPLAFLKEFN